MTKSAGKVARRFGKREFDTPETAVHSTFLDAYASLFAPLEDMELRRPDFGYMARVRDSMRIREDFRKAVTNLGINPIQPD